VKPWRWWECRGDGEDEDVEEGGGIGQSVAYPYLYACMSEQS
jgi:hypothetical protein